MAEQLNESLAGVVEAGEGVVMLAAVGAGGMGSPTVLRLRALAEGLEAVLREVDPQAKPVTTDWQLFLSRLGHRPGQVHPDEEKNEEAGELSFRGLVLSVARQCPDIYFTPQYVYEVLRKDPQFNASGHPNLRKAVQNATAGLANSKKIARAARGQYITPGRERDAVQEQSTFGDPAQSRIDVAGRSMAAGVSFDGREQIDDARARRYPTGGKAA
ncbi:hypothetical protein [Streptomyces sp. 16-176A]|uniref:hypothetical protein n=1 Tax=Streptomyces sp. 16-176A TaxID=2530458 RepID=UPI00345C8FFC